MKNERRGTACPKCRRTGGVGTQTGGLPEYNSAWCPCGWAGKEIDLVRPVRPIGDNVLIRVLPKPTVSKGGILLVSESAGREDQAIVLATGSGKLLPSGVLVPIDVEPGQQVRFDPYRVRLVIDRDSFDATGSAHAQGGQHAIVPADAIGYEVVP